MILYFITKLVMNLFESVNSFTLPSDAKIFLFNLLSVFVYLEK